MWSATTETSDNTKREVDDDCQCSSSGGGSSGSNNSSTTTSTSQAAASVVDIGVPAKQQQQQQQQQLNIFESNSKKETSSFGANFVASDAKKLPAADLTETGDSGFISGPQTSSNIYDEEDEDVNVTEQQNAQTQSTSKPAEDNKLSTAAEQQQQQQQQFNIFAPPQQKEEKIVLDSGCIDEDYDAADGDDEYDDDHDDKKTEAQQQQQQQQQQQSEQHSSEAQKLPLSPSTSHNTAAAAAAADPMILKNNVDAGMSQWFCQLSLQTDSRNSQQQQQVAGIGMNNLDSRRSTGNAFSNRQSQQQQAAGNSATTTTTNLTPSNAWEQFYQQNDDGDTPLHLACISGYADVVAALIRMAPHPCLFNIQNDEAQTPLHLAALTAQPKILRMLLIAGAEPTIRDRHGNTALHLACISGEEQCVRALTIPISASEINEAHRQYGHRSNDETVSYLKCASLPSDLEIRNYDGERCVHLAAQSGHIDILRILVLYGADINAREGKSGRTPLHIAIEGCNEDLANFLLDECQKLNLETATYAGLTAYQVACILNKSQMQNMLEKRGAETLPTPDSDYDSSDIETDLDDSKIYNRFGDPGFFVGYNGGNPMTVA